MMVKYNKDRGTLQLIYQLIPKRHAGVVVAAGVAQVDQAAGIAGVQGQAG